MIRTSNIKARGFVEARQGFKGNNTFGEGFNEYYKVYSYGYHFPIYVYKSGVWYGNKDKYSVTTSKHQNQLKPAIVDKWVNTETLKSI